MGCEQVILSKPGIVHVITYKRLIFDVSSPVMPPHRAVELAWFAHRRALDGVEHDRQPFFAPIGISAVI